MSRIAAFGLTALILAACQPGDPAPPAGPVTSSAPAASSPSAAASWDATRERYRQVDAAPSDPLEALEWRGVRCDHYASEFGGDGSERDQWLNAQMDGLACGEALAAEARAMRDAHSAEPDVAARLDAVLALYGQ